VFIVVCNDDMKTMTCSSQDQIFALVSAARRHQDKLRYHLSSKTLALGLPLWNLTLFTPQTPLDHI